MAASRRSNFRPEASQSVWLRVRRLQVNDDVAEPGSSSLRRFRHNCCFPRRPFGRSCVALDCTSVTETSMASKGFQWLHGHAVCRSSLTSNSCYHHNARCCHAPVMSAIPHDAQKFCRKTGLLPFIKKCHSLSNMSARRACKAVSC